MSNEKIVPDIVSEQYRQLLCAEPGLSREECERRFPELIAYVKSHISLVDLFRKFGFEVKPLSPDAPGVFIVLQPKDIAQGACPDCGSNLIVKERH